MSSLLKIKLLVIFLVFLTIAGLTVFLFQTNSIDLNTFYYFSSSDENNPGEIYQGSEVGLAKIAEIPNLVEVKKLKENIYVFLSHEENPDIAAIKERYYQEVEKDYKSIYGSDYVLEREKVSAPKMDSPCSVNRSKLQIGGINSNRLTALNLTSNTIPAAQAVEYVYYEEKFFVLALTCIGLGKQVNEDYTLIIYEFDTSNWELRNEYFIDASVDSLQVKIENGGELFIYYHKGQELVSKRMVFIEGKPNILSGSAAGRAPMPTYPPAPIQLEGKFLLKVEEVVSI